MPWLIAAQASKSKADVDDQESSKSDIGINSQLVTDHFYLKTAPAFAIYI